MRYSDEIIKLAKKLRRNGKTYGEINNCLGIKIPKSTLSFWCQDVPLPRSYSERIEKLNIENIGKARSVAVEINKIKREEFFRRIRQTNTPIASKILNKSIAKIALSMLCLGEASKSGGSSGFYLGSSNPRIIILFIELLKYCFDFKLEKMRCTVQCRADQNTNELERFWQEITGIPPKYFYKSRIDLRTTGKPTKKTEYKGVLRVDYMNTKIQLELESLASLIYNNVSEMGR